MSVLKSIANSKSVKKMCQLVRDLNSDRYDRSQTTDLNNSPTNYHPTTTFTAFIVYNSACRPILPQSGLCGGRGDIEREFRKKQRINAKSEPSKCSGLVISRRRQIYARIGVELRPQG